MAGQLDSGRYCYFVAQAANVSVENVSAMVLGGHGDDMVPVRSSCQIAGIPVGKFSTTSTLAAIETRTRKAGGEVVGLLGFGSAFVSPAWAALEMAEAIIYDKRKIIPVCAKLEGEYGVNGLFVGVPAIVGANGVEQVIELDLSDDEKAASPRQQDLGGHDARRPQDLRRGRRSMFNVVCQSRAVDSAQ
jgi:malate dehydrogenase